VTYLGAPDAVFTAVLEIIAADSGVPPYDPGGLNGYRRGPSGPWIITTSDREAGFISARATSRAAGLVGSGAAPDVHQINVFISPAGDDPPRTQVTVQGTARARLLANRIHARLSERFERLEP